MTIPKEVSGAMFAGNQKLTNDRLFMLIDAVRDLVEAWTGSYTPPDNKVFLSAGTEPFMQQLEIGLGESFLVEGDSLPQLAEVAGESGIIPSRGSDVGKPNPFLEAFGITLKYERRIQVLSVYHNSGQVVHFQHEGLNTGFPEGLRYAIASLAVLPDWLWDGIRQKGLVVGWLNNKTSDENWGGDGFIFVNETQEPYFTRHRSMGVLVMPPAANILRSVQSNPGLYDRRREMRPVGVFADARW